MSEGKEHHGLLYGALASLAISLMSVFVKLLPHIPFPTLVFFRFFLGLLFMLPSCLASRERIRELHIPNLFNKGLLRKHLVRDLCGVGAIFCYFFTISHLPLVNAITLSNVAPLFIPIVVFFAMKVIVPHRRVVALAVGFLGVLFILRPGSAFSNIANLVGLLGAICTAVAVTTLRMLSRHESTRMILFTYFMVASLVALAPMIAMWRPIDDLMSWVYILAIAIFGNIYQFFLTKAFTHASASKAGAMAYLNVVFGGFLGWAIWGEEPALWVYIGAALVSLSGIMMAIDRSTPRRRKGY